MKIPPQVILLRLKAVLEKEREKEKEDHPNTRTTEQKQLFEKVKALQTLLHHTPEQCDFLRTKNSHCFWCTCEFRNQETHSMNPSFFIPLKVHPETKESSGYGHFCSPNCALSWLYHENIPQHEKHERDQLIHFLFMPPNSQERFRPAPDPRLVLDKFTGTLTPEEYRSLFQTELFLFPLDYNVTRQWKEVSEQTDSQLESFYGSQFQGYRLGYRNRQKNLHDLVQQEQ